MNKLDPNSIICHRGVILRAMKERMPYVKFYDMMYFVNAIIGLLKKRILEDRMIIVDGFGTISRVVHKPRRLYNVNKKDYNTVVSYNIYFSPHEDFLSLINLIGKDFIKELVRKKSRIEISKRKFSKVLI